MTVKYLKKVRCTNADGARSRSNPQEALVQDQEYLVIADVQSAETPERLDASGYFLYNPLTGRALPRLYKRNRFVDVVDTVADPLSAPVAVQPPVAVQTPAAPPVDSVLAAADSPYAASFDVGDEVAYNGVSCTELGLVRGQAYTVHMVVNSAVVSGGVSVAGLVLIDEDAGRVLPGVFNVSNFSLY